MNSIKSIKELINYIIEVNEEIGGQWWWRGQERTGWDIIPRVFRDDQFKLNESARLLRFKKKSGVRHNSVPKQNEIIEWLFLMQHYGLPTRLLDWTESPLIACFFAVKRSSDKHLEKDGDDGELIAIHPYTLNQKTINQNYLLMPEGNGPKELIANAYSGKSNDKRIIAIRPYEVDIRMMVQISQFTIHGSASPLESIDGSDSFLRKIKIPANKKNDIREELKYLGIRESIIFPDLDHLADEIRETNFRDPRETPPNSIQHNFKTPPENNINNKEPSS